MYIIPKQGGCFANHLDANSMPSPCVNGKFFALTLLKEEPLSDHRHKPRVISPFHSYVRIKGDLVSLSS